MCHDPINCRNCFREQFNYQWKLWMTSLWFACCCFALVFFTIMALLSCLNSEESNYYNSPRKYMDYCANFPWYMYNARLLKDWLAWYFSYPTLRRGWKFRLTPQAPKKKKTRSFNSITKMADTSLFLTQFLFPPTNLAKDIMNRPSIKKCHAFSSKEHPWANLLLINLLRFWFVGLKLVFKHQEDKSTNWHMILYSFFLQF